MDPNYASAGGGGGGGGVIGGTAIAAKAVPGSAARYNSAYFKDSVASCQRSAYDPYGASRASSLYPYDAEVEFKERTGMGKTKSMVGIVSPTNSTKIPHQHSYNQNSCYSGSYSSSCAPERANYYTYTYEQLQQQQLQQQQQQQQPHVHQYPQQQYHHQSQLQQQQYKYNKLVSAQQQQQQQHQQQKISPPDYGYSSFHHPYYHPHYHHPSTQKGVGVMKAMPDASSSMPYVSSKMMTARAPQYPTSNYTTYQLPQSSYPPVVSAGHHHTYQNQSVCEDSRWMWNSSSGNEYNSCRNAATYPAYVNGSALHSKQQQQTTMWPPPHPMPMQYQSQGYATAAAADVAPNQSCCPPTQGSATAYYPHQYVKYPVLQSAADYSNDLYGSSSQGNLTAVSASGKVYTDLSGNSYQQSVNNAAFHHHHHQQQQQQQQLQQQQQHQHQQQQQPQQQQQQQPGNYSASPTSSVNYNSARYLQQQQQQLQQTDSPSSLSSTSSTTSSYNHHYYHPYQTYSNVEPHQETYQQQVDPKIKAQSLRDFLTSWNEDEDEMNATEVPFMEQLHLTPDHFAQDNGMSTGPVMENHLQFKGSFSSSSRPKIHVGITVDSTVEADQYINLPDIIIDIEKSNKEVVSLAEDCLVTNIPKIEKEELLTKQEMPNHIQEIDKEKEKLPKKQPNNVHREKKTLRRKCGRSKRHQRHRFTQRNQRKSKVTRRRIIRRGAKKQTSIILRYTPQSLKCLCVSLLNSDKFRNGIFGRPRSEIDDFLNNHLTANTAAAVAVAVEDATPTVATTDTEANTVNVEVIPPSPSTLSSVIPKLSDLCKNALNSSFDRDVLVINLDEILDSDNLFVVQCDINENILGNFVDEQQQNNSNSNSNSNSNNDNDIVSVSVSVNDHAEDLVEILNDNNNNNGSSTPIRTNIKQLKRCCSLTEVSNLPLDNPVEHNNFNLISTSSSSSSTNPILQYRTTSPPPQPPPPAPPSPAHSSISCPATLLCGSHSCPSSPFIEKYCPQEQQQIPSGHDTEQIHEMLMLAESESEVVKHNEDHRKSFDNDDDVELLLESSKVVTTPSIHHEEIVPDNLKKFENEKFLKYLHTKYVQGNLSKFYHANRIIKKYKKRIIKKILNIVR